MDSGDEVRASRKRRNTIIESSTDEDEISEDRTKTPTNEYNGDSRESSTRSSARIAKKRSQSFEMPTRESVWKTITPSKSASKYQQLAPRKLVNNFTRENHRYNYDPNYTSGEESLDNFIDDSDTSSESSSSSVNTRAKRRGGKKRVRNRKERVIVQTSSDTDSENDDSINDKSQREKHRSDRGKNNSEHSEEVTKKCIKQSKRGVKTGPDSDDRRHSNESGFEDNVNAKDVEEDNSDEETLPTPHGSQHKNNVINSEDENDNRLEFKEKKCCATGSDRGIKSMTESDEEMLQTPRGKRRKSNVINSEDESNSSETSEGKKSCAIGSDKAIEMMTETPGTSIKDDKTKDTEKESNVKTDAVDDENDDAESSSDDGESGSDGESDSDNDEIITSSRARVQMLKKKRAKLKLFEQFREERNRKLSKEGKSG